MMKWIKRILLGFVAVVLLAVAVVYGWGEMIIRKDYTAQARAIALSTSPETIQEGERLAQVFGCFHGCHGKDMEGGVFFEAAWIGSFYAPDLTAAAVRYTPAELEAIVRQGVRPDGRTLFGMPSDSFSIMTDEHLSAILSFIKSYPEQDNEPGASSFGPLARLGLIMGEYSGAAEKAQPEPWAAEVYADSMKLGEYLATTACSECHGLQLEGTGGFTPPLIIAKSYSLDDFRRLMREGIGLGDRDLGLMSQMAEFRLKHLKDEEIEALHAYLQAR